MSIYIMNTLIIVYSLITLSFIFSLKLSLLILLIFLINILQFYLDYSIYIYKSLPSQT